MNQRIKPKTTTAKPVLAQNHLPNFVALIRKYRKAVMGMEVIQETIPGRIFPFSSPWERGDERSFRSVNIGTGFVFHPKGYILTNEHVIHGASQVSIRVYGKKEPIIGEVVGSDPSHDIAVLRTYVQPTSPILKLGKTKDIQVGEWVLAIGSPLGLDNTVTVGIVSAKDRPMQIGERKYPSLIQTDAAINRGNSGGPLINLKGEVIGMNTAVSQSSQGIGFAISADVLRETVQKIIRDRV